MVKRVLLLCVCIVLLVGCSSSENYKNRYVNEAESTNENSMLSAYAVSREYSGLRENIAIYEDKLLYSEMDSNTATVSFYVLDFQTAMIKKVGAIDNFVLRGRSKVLINDTLYLYITITDGTELRNVLFAFDFSDSAILKVSENEYTKPLIPLINVENRLYALQGNQNKEVFDSFLERFDEEGMPRRISLEQDRISNSVVHSILYIDSDGENILALEGIRSEQGVKYYFTKYTSDLECVSIRDISSIFNDYSITESIGLFYAFDEYFVLTDIIGTTILCKCEENEIQVLLCESDLEYVVNLCRTKEFEFFYVRKTNDIYRLHLPTGVIEMQDYKLDNERSVIRSIIAFQDTLMISKRIREIESETEMLYLIGHE